MLGKLFGSKARVKILKIFLHHPSERYYIRQLSRDLDLQVNSVRRELENLEKFGLLLSNTDVEAPVTEECDAGAKKTKKTKNKKIVPTSNKKYYYTNKDFVLFEEIKALVVKAQILYEKDFIEKLKNAGQAKLLVLAGFFVNQVSPVDIFIVGRFNRMKFLKVITELENELDREINFTIMDLKEFKYRRDITDIFLYDVLEGRKIVVVDNLGL